MPGCKVSYDPQADYYAVLDVSPRAVPADILHAYRTAVKKHHPDAGGDPAGRMIRRVIEAYHVLRHPALRGTYDRLRREARYPGRQTTQRIRRPRSRRPLARRVAAAVALCSFIGLGVVVLAIAIAGVREVSAAAPTGAAALARRPDTASSPFRAPAFDFATPFDEDRPAPGPPPK